jgi:hypothetical protein
MHNLCYQKYHNTNITPTGIVVHSTAEAGRVIKRFVQPYSGQTQGLSDNGKPVSADKMIQILGKNYYNNDWNREDDGWGRLEVCVHAFLGQLADGSYAVCKTLPYTMPCWGAGTGPKGSYNGCYNGSANAPLYIQFEMVEDLNTESNYTHCKRLYDLAVEYCAHLCKTYPTIKISNIISHREAHLLGCGSNHGDPDSYWSRCKTGFTMDKFRKDVAEKLEELTMTQEVFNTMFQKALTQTTFNAMLQKGLTQAVCNTVLQKALPKIKTVKDVPASLKQETQELIDLGVLKGTDSKGTLNLTLGELRCMIVNLRLHKLR